MINGVTLVRRCLLCDSRMLHRRNLVIRSIPVKGVRYPLRPTLNANLNSRTVNKPLINSFIRCQTSKTTQDTKELIKHDGSNKLQKLEVEQAPKLSMWEKVKHEVQHYWSGTKLLGFEVKVSTILLFKMLAGYSLSRRESNQLQRTLTDVVRLVPFSMFIIVPFAELLLPVALKLFPNLLPSTYESKTDRKKKTLKLSNTRSKVAEFINSTMKESGLQLSKKITDEERESFVSFFHSISLGQNPSKEHLIKVARMFKNDQVLDNLSRSQLVAMARYMSLRPFGTDSILRYQIRHRLLTIIKDDKAIDYEGVESLTVPELYIACSQRGIKTAERSPARLREELEAWLDLRLRKKIPSTLLILSSTYTYNTNNTIDNYYDALLAVLSSIPDEVYDAAKLELSDDSKLKLGFLKEQNQMIDEENLKERDTVNRVRDHIKLDEYEESASEGMKIEPDEEEEKREKRESDSKGKNPLEVKP